MKCSAIFSATLPALAVAQNQISLVDQARGWFEKGKAYVQSAVESATAAPVRAAVAQIADKNVHSLTMDNWQDTIKHSGKVTPYNAPEAWMVFVYGGNTTCFGHCERAIAAWNESVALLAADPSSPNLASINCEENEILCGSWMVDVPSVEVLIVPQPLPDQSAGKTDLYYFPMNMTTITAADITKIHTRKVYLNMQPYEGILHPVDGLIAKLGLTKPLASFIFYLGKIPSWAMMIGVSMFSRSFMGRRTQPQPQRRPQAGAPAAAS